MRRLLVDFEPDVRGIRKLWRILFHLHEKIAFALKGWKILPKSNAVVWRPYLSLSPIM